MACRFGLERPTVVADAGLPHAEVIVSYVAPKSKLPQGDVLQMDEEQQRLCEIVDRAT